MARKVHDKTLDSRQARGKLAPQAKPYFRLIDPGLHLGYRKLKGKSGTWVARHYVGAERYEIEKVGTADDVSDPDGVAILDYWQAVDAARAQRTARSKAADGCMESRTVNEVVEDYLTWVEQHRKDIDGTRSKASAHILPALGHIDCDKLTTDQLEKWLHDLANSPVLLRTRKGEKRNTRKLDKSDAEAVRARKASANRIWTVLRAALNRAWRKGKIASDDAWRKVEPFEEVDGTRLRYLSIAEVRRLVNACDPEFRLLVQGALETGARYGELCRLRVHDFNQDSGTVHVRTSKGRKARHIVLTAAGQEFFKSATLGRGGRELMFSKTIPGAHGMPDTTMAWGASHQERPIAEACMNGKIDPPITFHGLRHTWASHAVMNGVPLMVVAKNMGHRDTRMVEKHYGHLAPSYVAEAIRAGAPVYGLPAGAAVASLDERRVEKR